MEKGYWYIISSVLIFSSMGLFVRFISLSGLIVYFFAALISMLIFGSILIKEKKLKSFFKKKYFWIPVSIGIFGVINNVSYFYAYNLTTIANSTFVHYLAPVLVMLFAPVILSEKTEKKIWYVLILSLIGLFILINPTSIDLGSKSALGILLAFVSAMGYAFGVLLVRKASKKHFSSKEIVFSQMFFSVLILLPIVIYQKPEILSSDILPLLSLGFIHQGLAVLLMFRALKLLPAQNVSVISYLEPVGAVILAFIFLKEVPRIATLIGGALILISCYSTIKFSKSRLLKIRLYHT